MFIITDIRGVFMQIHVVLPADTAYSIALQYGIPVSRLIYDNQLETPDDLVTGQALLILEPEILYTTVSGDTIFSIASAFGISEKQLIRNNPFLLANLYIQPDQSIVISYKGQSDVSTLYSGGYAYTFIDQNILTETLPFLTELYIFSYGFTKQGNLIYADDELLIRRAGEFRVRPILVLTSLNEQGNFSNELVNILLENMQVQNNVVAELVNVVQAKGYDGIDLDFEFILPQDRDAYVEFTRRLAGEMHSIGRTVSVALPPKYSADQPGLLYEGIDYRGLGEAADHVLLMTYEWGYTYGPPMAVAPIPQVRRIVDYAITEIPVNKINLGIPNYGYDWPLPYEKGVTRADTIGNIQAVNIARENGAVIKYDSVSKAPYFNYIKNGVEREVWFEDVRSIQEKFNLIKEYGLRGAGYWNLMRGFRPNWLLLNNNFNIISN